MDIENMHVAVKLELDKSSALELPAFEPEEIDLWLNNAIRKFVKTRYGGMNVKGTSFEQTQKRADDLRVLISSYEATVFNATTDFPNSIYIDLPVEGKVDGLLGLPVGNQDYWFTIQEEVDITVAATSVETRNGITECTFDEYRQKIDDPYSEHILHYGLAKPLRLNKDDGVYLVTDGAYNISGYYLTYLKAPATVDNVPAGTTDCDLPEHTHDEIVKLAVSMMLENIEQPRYQTYQNEANTIE